MWKIYEKPLLYVIIHVGLGIISAWFPIIMGAFLIYQGAQLVLDRRFFMFEGKIEEGNSLGHTGVKIAEAFAGYAIGATLR